MDGAESHVVVNDSLKPAVQISELFRAVTAKLTPILSYSFSQLVIYEPSTGQLATRGCYFPNGKGLIYEGLRFPIENTPAGRVFTSGKPMCMNRTENLVRSDLIERLLAEGARSGCCVPVQSDGKTLGTFSIGSTSTYAFNSETAHVLMAIGSDLGALLERCSPSATRLAPDRMGESPFSSTTKGLLTSVIVRQVLAGNIDLFRELVLPYEKAIYRIAFSVLHNHAEAEEIVQDAIFKALTHLHQLQVPTKFRQWLLQIALNEARIRRRQNRNHAHDPIDGLEERFLCGPPSVDPVEQREFQMTLRQALSELPSPYREILVLRDIQDRTVAETATALGISIASVKTRLHRARRALRNSLPVQSLRAS